MTETIIRLIEGNDITGKDPNTGKLVGGDIVIFQEGESASGLNSIAFRRGCGRIPSTCTLFKDGKCSATNIVSQRLLNKSILVEEEGTVGPHQILCGERMERSGLLIPVIENFDNLEKFLKDQQANS